MHRATISDVPIVLVGVVFLLVPGIFFVIGCNTKGFGRLGPFGCEDRQEYLLLMRRMFWWFLSADAILLLYSTIQ